MKMDRYRPDIDGLRAISVLAVFLFHSRALAVPGGYVGVDIFFVISGYLIGKLVYDQARTGSFSFIAFYERRARRLAGPLLIVIAATVAASCFILMPLDLANLSRSAVASLFFVSNHYFYSQSGYFDFAETKPLLHLWSLAVEEQFYLLFPLLLVVSLRLFRSALPIIFVGAISFAISVVVVVIDQPAAFFLLPFRGWELLIGFGVYLLENSSGLSWLRESLGLIGIGLIAFALATFSTHTPFPGNAALAPCMGAALIIYAGAGSIVGRLLSLKPLPFIGRISYALYLWHWPIIVLVEYYLDQRLGVRGMTAVFAVSFLLSYLTLICVERPIRLRPPSLRFEIATASIAISIAGAAVLHFAIRDGAPWRLPASSVQYAAARNDWSSDQFRCVDRPPSRISADDVCRHDEKPSILLWGDSVATSLLPLVQRFSLEHRAGFIFIGTNGCPPMLGVETASGYCIETNNAVIQLLERLSVQAVLVSANWRSYGSTNLALMENSPVTRDDKRLQAALTYTLSRIGNTGSKPVVIGEIPAYEFDVPASLAKVAFLTPIDRALGYARPALMPLQDVIYPITAARVATATTFLPRRILCTPACKVADGSVSLYKDGGHLSYTGAQILYPSFSREVHNILGER